MIKVIKNIHKQLAIAQKAKFCSIPNSNSDSADVSKGAEQPPKTTTGKNHQNQGQTGQKEQFQKRNHSSNQQHQDSKSTHSQNQNQQAQGQQSSTAYGSKINAGNSEEIKKSIQKSVSEFASQYKLGMAEKKIKTGNKQTFAKKENEKSSSQKKQALLSQIKPTEEPLQNKYIVNIPIAQQVVVDRLKKYALRNSDTKRIHEHLKEEEGVDFSYVEPRNLEILNSHIHRKSEELEDLVSTYLGVNQTLSKAEQLEEWRKQQALDNVNFTPETMGQPEVFYPGSDKGPHPLDDPLNYIQWYERNCPTPYRPLIDQMVQIAEMKVTDNNMPSFIKKWIKQVQEDPQDSLKEKVEEEDDLDSDEDGADMSEDDEVHLGENKAKQLELEQQLAAVVGGGQGVFFYKTGVLPRLNTDNSSLWYLDQNNELPEDTSPEEQIINCEGNVTFHSGLQEYEIPPFPEAMTQYVTHYQIPIIDKWSVFRQFPNMYHWWKKFYETAKAYHEQPLQQYQYRGLPSLYTYYYTLPEFARNNIVVQNVARCFEINRHEISIEQKMMALNFAAKFSLPIDDLVAHAASQMIISQKHFLTAKEEDKLKTVNQFYYEADPEAFAIHLSHEEHTIEQIENFQAPKHLGVEEVEEQLCDLPLEFYDNEDGFWNDFIKEKNNRNHREYPTTFSRPFFKH